MEVLEQAGKVFYYSTKTGGQQVPLHHGVAISGAMDAASMTDFCREHDIGLIIDAAHPFAVQLHSTVAEVAQVTGIPAVRYERIFPERESDIIWLDSYAEAMDRIGEKTLLAATGVQSIAKLKPLEEKGVKIDYRILPREDSIAMAKAQGVDKDQLLYYTENEHFNSSILQSFNSYEAILLKESGTSGHFAEKVAAARALGMKIYALKRPAMPSGFHQVNGVHGLRRMVEKLLPEFFPLHSGLTTGTCATAAAVAATQRLLNGDMPEEVSVTLPDGEAIMVGVGYGYDYAYCIKEAGDDPDATDGIEVRAHVERAETFRIIGGQGVGRFTVPGFDYGVGEAAINKGPRQMIRENIERLTIDHGALAITISVPGGEEIASCTFNPRLGIEGGISIIGVSGIVMPYSEAAFIGSIHKCMEVAKASGTDCVVINSGAKSERFLKARYNDLPDRAFVQYGNHIGETLKIASALSIPRVILGIMLGKAVKLAAGCLDTHSHRQTMDKPFIEGMLAEAGCNIDIAQLTLARELWGALPPDRTDAFARTVIAHCYEHCRPLLPHGQLTILLIDDEGQIYL